MTAHATAASDDSGEKRVSLRRLDVAWVDRVLPARPRPFIAVVVAASVACWLAGLLLAEDRGRFLASHEWQVQPLYLAIHLVVVRLFVTTYAGEYVAGCASLEMSREEVERHARRVLGPVGFVIALVLAAPLAVLDIAYIQGADFESATVGSGVGPADWLLAAMWSVEWLASSYVWVVIGGFLAATLHALARHPFRDPVRQVLRERQYRPFLVMSAHGASIVLGLAAANALYVLYAEGETTDHIGLWVTTGLLLVGFVPPWLRLRGGISALVRAETDRLGAEAEAGWQEGGGEERPADAPRTLADVARRIDVALALLRIEHLERLHRDVGRVEAQAVIVRLLAPLGTVVWRLTRG